MADNGNNEVNNNTTTTNDVENAKRRKTRKIVRKPQQQRLVNPDAVTDKAKWYFYKKKNYSNLVIRQADGALLVLDPKTLDIQTPAKTFLPKKGQMDALVAIYSDVPELRAKATEHMETLETERSAAVESAAKAYREVEQEMLAAVAEWRLQSTPSDRQTAARRVGVLQAQLVDLDEQRQQAIYPQRFVRNEKMSYMAIDYEMRKESSVPYAVFATKHLRDVAANRAIEVGTA